MITAISFSILGGISIPALYNKFIKKYIIIKNYHFHHTLHALLLLLWSISLFLRDKSLAPYTFGVGIGLAAHHLVSEKHLKPITRVK